MVGNGERTAFSNALVVPAGEMADYLRPFHLHAKVLLGEVNGRQERQVGIPLAAAWTANLSDLIQRLGRHPVGEAPRLLGQRCGLGDDGDEHPGADGSTASAPESAGSAGDRLSSMHHLHQGGFQINGPTGILVGCQKSGAYHDMMLRAVHMAEGLRHHLVDDFHGIL